jgi:hypothetical protein
VTSPKPASAFFIGKIPPGNSQRRRVSRFGVIPKPTVIVRMKENGCEVPRVLRVAVSFRVP